MRDDRQNTLIIWQHVADYSDLVREFYKEKGTLMQFPIFDVHILEKIIRELTQTAYFEPCANYSEEIEQIIWKQIERCTLDVVQRTVKVFNYDASKNSKKLFSLAISHTNLDVLKWLVNEMSCITEETHLRRCIYSWKVSYITDSMKELKDFYIETIERNRGKNIFERAFNKLKSFRRSRSRPSISRCIANLEMTYLLSTLADLDPLKITLRRVIERNCGKNLLKRILARQYSRKRRHYLEFLRIFETIRFLLSTLNNLESIIESDELREKYSENNLLECFFICGRTHYYYSNEHSLMRDYDWNDLHRAAYENKFTAVKSIDPTLIDSRDEVKRTPLMIAVGVGACEVTTVLLEKYSANVNVLDIFGDTPLSRSVEYSYHLILTILLRLRPTGQQSPESQYMHCIKRYNVSVVTTSLS